MRPAIGWVAVAAAVAVVAVVVVAIGSVGAQRHPGRRSGVRGVVGSGWPRLLLRGVDSLQAYSLGGSMYLAEQLRPGESASTLVRLGAATGQAQARTELGAGIDDVVLAHGSLWVTTTKWPTHGQRGTATLLRLDPESLDVRSTLVLPGSGAFSSGGSLAVAGGWLWVGGFAGLDRVSPSTAELSETVPVPGAQSVLVVADASGRVLLASVGDGRGDGHVQRRDAATGALLASSAQIGGTSAPAIEAVVDGGAWFVEPTGMLAHIARVDVTTLRQTLSEPSQAQTRGPIGAQELDGVLWISEPGPAAERDYCADALTGRPLASLHVSSAFEFLTADAQYVYLEKANVGGDARAVLLIRQPISPRCR
jgi:hypothetical protein